METRKEIMNGELLKIVESIHRDKSIDKEIVFTGIESALLSAARKHYGGECEIDIAVDRETGEVKAFDGDTPIDPGELGRIAAQTAKQVIIQKIREAERDVLYIEYEQRVGDIVTGAVSRFEGPNIIINIGNTEAVLPREEQIRGETFHSGEHVRAIIKSVEKVGPKLRIVASRTDASFVVRLFELEVPELAEHIIEVKGIAREAGRRTKIAVASHDSRVDCVGACVGVRGTRIKNVIDELGGEKIDIVRWNESPEVFIMYCLKPAQVSSVEFDYDTGRAMVIVEEDQLSLAIGKKGQNVRLAAKLTDWEIDIVSAAEAQERKRAAPAVPSEEVAAVQRGPGGLAPETLEVLRRHGLETVSDILEAGQETLSGIEGVGPEIAEQIIRYIARVEQEYERSESLDEDASDEDGGAPVGAKEAPVDSQQAFVETEEAVAETERAAGEPEEGCDDLSEQT